MPAGSGVGVEIYGWFARWVFDTIEDDVSNIWMFKTYFIENFFCGLLGKVVDYGEERRISAAFLGEGERICGSGIDEGFEGSFRGARRRACGNNRMENFPTS